MMSLELLLFPMLIVFVIAIVLYLVCYFTAQKFLPAQRIQPKMNLIIAILLIISLVDFLIGTFFPFLGNGLSFELKVIIICISLITSLISIPVLFSLSKIYPFDIASKKIVRHLLKIAMTLVIISQIIVVLSYGYELLALFSDVTQLLGTNFIFEIGDPTILTEITESFPNYLLLVLILILKSLFVISHHSALLICYIGVLFIFWEWGIAMRDPIIGYFKIFAYGYLLQGVGQLFLSFWLIIDSFGVFASTNDLFYFLLDTLQFTGGILATLGVTVYYFAFAIACLNLLSNIEHLIFPQWLIITLKCSSVIIPTIYGILYSFNFLGSLLDLIFKDPFLYDLLDFNIQLTHLVDIVGVWLVPLAAGAFFFAGYIRSKEKPNVTFSSFLILSFLSVFLIFYAGNNTLTVLTWTGLIHGQFGIVGILFFMYSLSRVAEHASRYRQVIRKIRENPEDFMFLAELGRSERKLRAWEKIDSMSKEGIIKPLTPIKEKEDDTKIAAEINSYMAELEAIRSKRARTRSTKKVSIS